MSPDTTPTRSRPWCRYVAHRAIAALLHSLGPFSVGQHSPESCQSLRQRRLVQHAEALGGAREGHVELGRTAWAFGEDPVRFHHQNGVELEALGFRRHHRARHTRWTDHDAGALALSLVPDELLDGSGQFFFGDLPGPWQHAKDAH